MKAILLLLATSTAFADDSPILRCRELADPSSRLACYDSLPATAGTAPRQTPDRFGMADQGSEKELDVIESRIDGRFDGWGPNDRIQFANGQIWQISDNSSRMLDAVNPKVRVRRGMLGAFYLEIEGTNHSPRVKRVR